MELNEIKLFVEKFTELDITLKTRQRTYVYARSIYFYLARKHTKFCLQKIAQSMDMDHASVIHSLNNIVPVVMKYDVKLANLCRNFEQIHKDSIENITTTKEDLISENAQLKSELIKYKSNRLVNLVGSVPTSEEGAAYEKIELMIKVMKEKEKVEGC
jgi:hypothetical protein